MRRLDGVAGRRLEEPKTSIPDLKLDQGTKGAKNEAHIAWGSRKIRHRVACYSRGLKHEE